MSEPMPAATERRAPRFEGDGRTLVQFFKDYKRLTDAAKLSVHDAIIESVKYMAKDPRRLVEKTEEYRDVKVAATGKEWDEFVERVKMDYSDADAPVEYTKADFDNFIQQNREKAIRTVDDLVAFTRDYRCYASDPKKKGELSDAALQRTYYNHLMLSLGTALTLELKVAYKDKRPYELSITEIQKAAKAILREAESEDFRYGTDVKPVALTAVSAPYAYATAVKNEDAGSLYALISSLGEKIDGMGSRINRIESSQQQRKNDVRAQPTVNVSAPGATIQASTGDKCYFCGKDGHRIPSCEHVKSEVAKGRIKRLTEWPYRLVLPDGSTIRTPAGGLMMDGVEEWHKRNPQKSGGVATMLVEIADNYFPSAFEPEFDSRVAESAWVQVMAQTGNQDDDTSPARYPLRSRNPFANAKSAQTPLGTKKPARDVPPHEDANVDRIPPSKRREKTQAEEPKAAQPAQPRREDQYAPVEVERYDAPVIHAHPAVTVPGATALHPPVRAPQFRVQAPVENEGLTKVINNRILATNVVLTFEELLAVSPGLRRHWATQTTPKRVTIAHAGTERDDGEETGGAAYFYREVPGQDGSRDLISARPALPLRYLDCYVSHGDKTFLVEGVVDDGSQMVLISKQFWTALGKPLNASHVIPLEAANNTKSQTLGLCADLCLNIGGLEFYVQAHVVEDAPFSLLLGQPFIALTEMESKSYYDGSSVVTLNDLNTNRAVRIPTRARAASRAPAQPLDF